MFVPSLYNDGAIKKNMFAIFIDQNGESKIQIGGYDLSKYAIGGIKWYDLAGSSFWAFEFGDVKVGKQSFKPSVTRIMADTGTSLNMVPDVDFFKLKNMFFDPATCETLENSLSSCDCTEAEHKAIPNITFKIDGDEFVIPRDQWVDRAYSLNKCVIKLMHAPGRSEWILGVNFF